MKQQGGGKILNFSRTGGPHSKPQMLAYNCAKAGIDALTYTFARAGAEAILASIDIMAERVRRIGGTTIRSISHIAHLQTIADGNTDFVPAGEMVKRLLEDNGHIDRRIREAIAVCEKHRDSATSNVLQEILDETESRKWFLFEVIQGVNNTD